MPARRAAESVEGKPVSEAVGFVRYIGLADPRGITRDDLKAVNLDAPMDYWWSRENQFVIPRRDIPDDVYVRAIEPDPEFVLLAPDGSKEG